MAKEKMEHEPKHKIEHEPMKEHHIHDDCKENCACNANQGATCGCGCGGNCSCGTNCQCGCHKKCGGKIILLLLVFLAGMGFNQLWRGCMGRCPHKMPHNLSAMHTPIPAANDGGTTIVINTADGCADVWSSKNNFHKHHKHHKGINSDNFKNAVSHQHPSVPKADTADKVSE